MSYQFTAADLTAMRAAQVGHMLDVGNVQPVTVVKDTMGQMVETWSSNSADIVCGLDMRSGSERHSTNNTVVEYDATVRVPLTTVVDIRDRFRVTKRFGETLGEALVYDIVSPPQRGPTAIRLLLRRVET